MHPNRKLTVLYIVHMVNVQNGTKRTIFMPYSWNLYKASQIFVSTDQLFQREIKSVSHWKVQSLLLIKMKRPD